jgi:hypothetical protein
MAISIVGQPEYITPVFNPIFFYVDSTNKNEQGFKYIVDVFNTDTNINIGTYKLFGRPVDGYGVADINQLLANQVSFDLNQLNNVVSAATNSQINYYVSFGEEYIVSWDWYDTEFVPSGPYSTPDYTLVVSTGTSNTFIAGDKIILQQNPGYSTNVYNGIFTVLSANSSTLIIDVPFVVGYTVGGTAVYADKGKTVFNNLASATGYTAFNGAIGHQQFLNYQGEFIDINLFDGAFLMTDVPSGYTVKPTNLMWLNYYLSDGHTQALNLTSQNDIILNTVYGQYVMVTGPNSPLSATTMQTVGIGPYNVGQVEGTVNPYSISNYWANDVGTYPIFKNICWEFDTAESYSGGTQTLLTSTTQSPWYTIFTDEAVNYVNINGGDTLAFIESTPTSTTVALGVAFSAFSQSNTSIYQRTDWYEIYINGAESSQTLRFNVDWNTTRYGNFELVFLDKMGSMIPANFECQNARSINITRQEYTTFFGNLMDGKWNYTSTERGRTQTNTIVKHQIDLISNWISEDEASFLQELYSSPAVYIKENGQLWPVIVSSNSYQMQTKNNKKNIQIKITIEYANNDTQQNF